MQSSRYARPSQSGGGNSGNNFGSKPPASSVARQSIGSTKGAPPAQQATTDPLTAPSKYATTAVAKDLNTTPSEPAASSVGLPKSINANIPSKSPSTGDTLSTEYISTEEKFEDRKNGFDAKDGLSKDDRLGNLSRANQPGTKPVPAQPRAEVDKTDGDENPRKAPRTDNVSTPGAKRKFQDMIASSTPTASNTKTSLHSTTPSDIAGKDTTLFATSPTTKIESQKVDISSTPVSGEKQVSGQIFTGLDDAFLDLVSPLSAPQLPTARKDYKFGATPASSLAPTSASNAATGLTVKEIAEVLKSEDLKYKVEEGSTLWEKLEDLCRAATRRTRGVVQSRDITKKVLLAREVKIEELQHRIKTLEAELDAEREIVKALRENVMD